MLAHGRLQSILSFQILKVRRNWKHHSQPQVAFEEHCMTKKQQLHLSFILSNPYYCIFPCGKLGQYFLNNILSTFSNTYSKLLNLSDNLFQHHAHASSYQSLERYTDLGLPATDAEALSYLLQNPWRNSGWSKMSVGIMQEKDVWKAINMHLVKVLKV